MAAKLNVSSWFPVVRWWITDPEDADESRARVKQVTQENGEGCVEDLTGDVEDGIAIFFIQVWCLYLGQGVHVDGIADDYLGASGRSVYEVIP